MGQLIDKIVQNNVLLIFAVTEGEMALYEVRDIHITCLKHMLLPGAGRGGIRPRSLLQLRQHLFPGVKTLLPQWIYLDLYEVFLLAQSPSAPGKVN